MELKNTISFRYNLRKKLVRMPTQSRIANPDDSDPDPKKTRIRSDPRKKPRSGDKQNLFLMIKIVEKKK